jgi:hypothetical protein
MISEMTFTGVMTAGSGVEIPVGVVSLIITESMWRG